MNYGVFLLWDTAFSGSANLIIALTVGLFVGRFLDQMKMKIFKKRRRLKSIPLPICFNLEIFLIIRIDRMISGPKSIQVFWLFHHKRLRRLHGRCIFILNLQSVLFFVRCLKVLNFLWAKFNVRHFQVFKAIQPVSWLSI